MSKKQSIKEMLEVGATIKVGFKEEINSWYDEYSIHKSNLDFGSKYYISPTMKGFENAEEAINEFCEHVFTSKNVGYIQKRLHEKGIDFENDYDLERPTKELREIFAEEGKLVDEEYKEKFFWK